MSRRSKRVPKTPIVLVSFMLISCFLPVPTKQIYLAPNTLISSQAPAQAPLPTYRVYLPYVIYPPPPAAPSYYVTNLSTIASYGTILGNQDKNNPGTQDNLVVLDFGYPASRIVGGQTNYGAFLVFDITGTFIPTSTIATVVKDFARNYYIGTGSDLTSQLKIVVGTNNCCAGGTLSLFQGHGTAWAQMLNNIQTQIAPYASQVRVVAGNDIEQDFNDPYASAQWLNTYITASNCAPVTGVEGCMYNFGNLVISISGNVCATSRANSWNACDVWYVSWGATKNGSRFPRPLPEIYHGKTPSYPLYGYDALQWKNLSIYSIVQKNAGAMYFVGSLTQRGNCGDTCNMGNNKPEEGFQLLYDALYSDTRTRQILRWSTDIRTQP